MKEIESNNLLLELLYISIEAELYSILCNKEKLIPKDICEDVIKILKEKLYKEETIIHNTLNGIQKYNNNITHINNIINPKITNMSFIVHELKTIKKIDAEDYIINYFKNRNYIIYKTSNHECLTIPLHNNLSTQICDAISDYDGRPDLVCIPNSPSSKVVSPLFIEVKTNGDGLRESQVSWNNRHPEYNTLVIYLKQILV